jgi:hypothetical protein
MCIVDKPIIIQAQNYQKHMVIKIRKNSPDLLKGKKFYINLSNIALFLVSFYYSNR